MKQSLIKKIKNNKNRAVSEVVGTILLLGISVTLFSVIYTVILSTPYSPPTPISNIVYSLNDKNLTLTNVGGKQLDLDTEIKILINNTLYKTYKVGDYLDLNDTKWGIGDKIKIDLGEYSSDIDYSFEVQVIDVHSNSIVIMGKTSIKDRPPIISSPEPYNNQNNIAITLTSLNISISEPENDAFRWTIETTPNIGNNSGPMQIYTQNNFQCIISGLTDNTNYTWYVNATNINGKKAEKTFTFTTSMTEPTVDHKDPVDNNSSNVDSSSDKGTETDFNNCKDNKTDTHVMNIKEYKPPSYNNNDTVDDNTANKDLSADKGTETNFIHCKDINPDSDVMNLEETNQGTAAINENVNVNGVTSTYTTWGTSGTTPWLSADDATNIITGNANNQQRGWFTFDDTTATGSGFTVVLYVDFDAGDGDDDCDWIIDWNGDGTTDASGTFTNPTTAVMNTGAIPGLDTATEINNARMRLDYKSSGGKGIMSVDHAYLNIQRAEIIDYELDMEYQFNNTNYNSDNKQLCFYLTTNPSESLNITYWSGGWIGLGDITHSGWTNFTAKGLTNSIYNIRIIDKDQNNELTQHYWNIDCMFLHTWNNSDYQVDFEYQFIGANYSDMHEKLCIFVTSRTGTEQLNINYWDGDSWGLLGTITGTGWKNVTATGLTSSTYTIQLTDAIKTSDSEQGDWNIDCIYLHTWDD